MTFFGIRKKIVAHASCDQEKSTTYPVVFRQIQRNFGMKAIAPHSCLSLVTLLLPSLTPAPMASAYSLHVLQLFTSPRLVLQVLHLRVTLPRFRPLFPLLLISGQGIGSSSPCRWLGDFVQETCSSFCTPDHTTDRLLVLHLRPLLLIPLLHLIQMYHRSILCPSRVEPRFLTISGQQLTNPPTVVRINSVFCFDLCRKNLSLF